MTSSAPSTAGHYGWLGVSTGLWIAAVASAILAGAGADVPLSFILVPLAAVAMLFSVLARRKVQAAVRGEAA